MSDENVGASFLPGYRLSALFDDFTLPQCGKTDSGRHSTMREEFSAENYFTL